MRYLAVLLGAVIVMACNPIERADEASEKIERFHADYNAQRDDAIWQRTGQEFKDSASREDLQQLIDMVRRNLGQMEESEQIGINMNSNLNGSFTVVTTKSHFEKGLANEVFTFIARDDELELVGWNVRSDDLMRGVMEDAARAAESEGAM
ncbi:hypothetical protein [Qipengyuania sp. JC766]|uniref:hypothetical protein n=1 Tax=Qipengyuania sp. JC766 TaxID=3232139 RepID=UPI00345986B3